MEDQEAGGKSKIFLRRAHVPAGPRSAAMQSGMNKPVNLAPREILPGRHVNVHGREFFVYDMDSFTRSWLQDREGLPPSTLGPVDVAALLPRRAPAPVAELPPHNGFGQPEDSAQNCRRLVPTPPPKDQYRLLNKSKVTLGFKCLLVEDPQRKRTLLNDTERYAASRGWIAAARWRGARIALLVDDLTALSRLFDLHASRAGLATFICPCMVRTIRSPSTSPPTRWRGSWAAPFCGARG